MADDLKPHSIRLEASSHCQLRCPSCPTTTGAIVPTVGKGFLRVEDFERLIDGNSDLREVELSNYGEAFLNPQLLAILESAHARNVTMVLANGTNLNTVRPEVLEGIVKFGLRRMTCSIDGASQETYQRYRVRGDYDRVIANIRAINQWKEHFGTRFPEMVWQFVVFGHNQHELETAAKMAETLGMRFVVKLSWDDTISPTDPDTVRAVMGVASRKEYREQNGKDYMQGICNQLWDNPQVNWDGKILGCCRNFWGDFGGNAFRDGLVPSLNTPAITHAREMLRGRAEPMDGIPCTTCAMYTDMRESGRFLERRD